MTDIGSFHWDEKERQLAREGVAVPLQPKVADTLAALLSRRGEIVEKAELMKMVWPDTTVEEINLERNISLLRKALGDDSGWIETVPKRGYRLRAPVPEQLQQQPQPKRKTGLWFAAALAFVTLVIAWQFYLPSRFVQLRPGQAYLAVIPFEGDRGAVDERIVAELVKQGRFSLLNPSVVRRYRWVGIAPSVMARIVGVELLVEGRVQQGSVVARLSDVRSGRVIWAASYPEDAGGPTESARMIADAIGRTTGE